MVLGDRRSIPNEFQLPAGRGDVRQHTRPETLVSPPTSTFSSLMTKFLTSPSGRVALPIWYERREGVSGDVVSQILTRSIFLADTTCEILRPCQIDRSHSTAHSRCPNLLQRTWFLPLAISHITGKDRTGDRFDKLHQQEDTGTLRMSMYRRQNLA